MTLTDMLIDAATSGADVEIRISYFYNGLDFDAFTDILSEYEFKSYVDYDKSIYLSFNGKKRQTEVKNVSSQVDTVYPNRVIKDYLGNVIKLREKLETFLIKDFTSAPSFEKFLHLVRFYQVKKIDLVDDKHITFDLDYGRFYRNTDDEGNIDYDNSWYNVPFRKEFIIESFLGKYIGFDNHIEICPENIEDDLNSLKSNPLFKLYKDNLLAKVLYHEYGHSIFLYDGEVNGNVVITNFSIFKETQANYFPSYVYKGKIDTLILDMTSRQPRIYRYPMFYSDVKNQYKDFINSQVRKLYVHDGPKGSDLDFPKPTVLKPIMCVNRSSAYSSIIATFDSSDAYGSIYPSVRTQKIKVSKMATKSVSTFVSKAMQAKRVIFDLINDNKLRDIDVECLKDAKICKALFNMNYPILVEVNKVPAKYQDRYHKIETITINGVEYQFTNDWPTITPLKKLIEWADIIRTHQPKF